MNTLGETRVSCHNATCGFYEDHTCVLINITLNESGICNNRFYGDKRIVELTTQEKRPTQIKTIIATLCPD